MGYDGATLTLTPWAAQALSDDERAALAVRAVELRCRVDVGKLSKRQAWVVTVSSWARKPAPDLRPVVQARHEFYAGRHLADCVAKALTDYAATQWTADELFTVAHQSGLA